MYICNLCSNTFNQKKNLNKHLDTKRCKSELLTDLVKLNQLLTDLSCQSKNDIVIPCIRDIYLDFVTPEYFKELIVTEFNDTFYLDNSSNSSNSNGSNNLQSDTIKIKHILKTFLKDIVCNKKYPQNQIIKYTQNNDSIQLIFTIDNVYIYKKDLSHISDTCNIIVYNILNKLELLFSNFTHYYKNDDKHFDYGLYQQFITKLQKHINQHYLVKILQNIIYKSILKNNKYQI